MPMRSDIDGDDCESLALDAVAIAAFTIHKLTLLLVFVEDEDSRRLRHAVDARDRRERAGSQPSSREAHAACCPSPYLQSFICVHLDAVLVRRTRAIMYAVERSTLLIIFRASFVQKAVCKFGVHSKGCRSDSACLILRPENPSHFSDSDTLFF